MDYIGNKCPVCQKYFHADDDIVVCPDCGTPHHRECYEQIGHCCNEELHTQGFDYTTENQEKVAQTKRCPSCGKENDSEYFFCKYCGSPLSPDQQREEQPSAPSGMPFGFNGGASGNIPFLDPLGGVPSDMDFGDGVTAGETAKYVKQNTPYFIRVFSNIKNFNKSKFNFSAALFMGGYLLYRKMYKLGALIAALQICIMLTELYITLRYESLFTDFAQSYANAVTTADFMNSVMQFIGNMSTSELLLLYLPTLMDILRVVMMIVIGICFNRMYLNHCKKQIVLLKENALSQNENAETLLQTKGGVNTALAVSLLITAMIILYLPRIIVGMM